MSGFRRCFGAVLLGLCLSCGESEEARPDEGWADAAAEAQPDLGTALVEDAGGPSETDASSPDGSIDDGGSRDGTLGKRLLLDDGTELVGEQVASYDRSLWWDTAPGRVRALFLAGAYAEYPNDRSMRFVEESRISSEEERSIDAPSYSRHARLQGRVLEGSPLLGWSYVITGWERYHLEENGYGDFAWDLVRTSSAGARYASTGSVNEDYFVFDEPVYLPVTGVVVEVERSAPDNIPGWCPQGLVNNLIGVHLGGSYYLYLLHFRQGSIPEEIVPGAVLSQGSYLGRVGNAGVSCEPHLHLTVLYYDAFEAEPRSWSVPSEFSRLSIRTATSAAFEPAFSSPRSGTWIRSAP